MPLAPMASSLSIVSLMSLRRQRALTATHSGSLSGETVGEYLGVAYEDETAATHRFLANMPGW